MTSGSVLAGGREPHSAFPSLDYICPNSTGRDRVSPLPEELRSLEPRVREQIGTHLARGKVDGTLRFQPGEAAAGAIEMNAEQVQRLLAASDHLRGLAPDVPSLRAIDILRWPGVIKVPPLDVESLGAEARACRSSCSRACSPWMRKWPRPRYCSRRPRGCFVNGWRRA